MTLTEIAESVGKALVDEIRQQIILQGHYLTGKLSKSVSYDTTLTIDGAIISFYIEEYGLPLNTGVIASRIPYGRVTKAKVSKYIQGLKSYAKARFRVTDKQALGIAFAIAKTHAKQGMPTFNSFKFSKTFERTGFIEDAIQNRAKDIEGYIQELEIEINLAA